MRSFFSEEEVARWHEVEAFVRARFGKKPDLKAILFLIGVQELGQGFRRFSKEEKQDLMHIAVCRILSRAGYYTLSGADKDGWPHWEPTEKLPRLNLFEQEGLLKYYVIRYFEEEIW